ncbi:hypothetical protein SAMN05421544_1123 [Riemerella columbipharyngis]|uniref:Uncharacterized protein n=1 Tax=Riemerella columbipharyngis TaxID=1071918 RepID=A0A1G7DQE3_9FLAO|nr:hypothetical protein SAMN05421544_1122 [Riemerella columbipharyngis]SDE53426.1 hypothetical protein SAMN05421544_1123 [Riemerella columbipharyngis]
MLRTIAKIVKIESNSQRVALDDRPHDVANYRKDSKN